MTHELDPIAPSPTEILFTVLPLVLHLALVALVLVRARRHGMPIPYGVLGLLLALLIPVVGPVLVLIWQERPDQHETGPRRRLPPADPELRLDGPIRERRG